MQLKLGRVQVWLDQVGFEGRQVDRTVPFGQIFFSEEPQQIIRIGNDGHGGAYCVVAEWYGKLRLRVRAEFVPAGSSRPSEVIYVKEVVADKELKFGGLTAQEFKADNVHHADLNWTGEGRMVRKETRHQGGFLIFGGSDKTYAIVVSESADLRRKQAAEQWNKSLKRKLIETPTVPTDQSAVEAMNSRITDYLLAESSR